MAGNLETRQGDFLQKPPYRAVDPATFDKKLQGGCHCGRVKYWLSQDQPLNAKFCHCRGCQVMHGELATAAHCLLLNENYFIFMTNAPTHQ